MHFLSSSRSFSPPCAWDPIIGSAYNRTLFKTGETLLNKNQKISLKKSSFWSKKFMAYSQITVIQRLLESYSQLKKEPIPPRIHLESWKEKTKIKLINLPLHFSIELLLFPFVLLNTCTYYFVLLNTCTYYF